MSLVSKIKEQKQGEGDFKRFTGICPVRITAINPTLSKLVEMGVNFSQEPVYTGDKDGVKTLRLDFWVNNPEAEYFEEGVKSKVDFREKLTFFLENKVKTSQSGKKLIVNNILQSTWADSIDALKSNEKMKWFKHDGIRESMVGEVELLEFLKKWLGISGGFTSITDPSKNKAADTVTLDTPWAKLIAGDVKELQSLVPVATEAGRGVRVLFGVTEKDGKFYQKAYMKYIMRGNELKTDKLAAALDEEYGEFKADYDGFNFKVYQIGIVTADKVDTTFQDSGKLKPMF